MASLSVSAKVVFPVGDWVYEKINNNTEFEIDAYEGDNSTLSTAKSHNNIPITQIGMLAFNGNTTLKSIDINAPITAIDATAFLNSTALETVNLNSKISIIGADAFAGCTALSIINLEDTMITSVYSGVFSGCDALTEVTLPRTVTSIGEKAFAYCDGLTKITIPESVTTIHDKAFYKSPNVVIYCYKDSAAHVYAESKGIEYVLLEPVETYLLGDVDGDNQVTIMDPTCLQLLLAHFIADEDGRMFIRSDIDHDGLNSIMDATCIQRYIAQFEDGTDIGKIYEY